MDRLPGQNDGISCGVFTCLYAYFRVLVGEWPSTNIFASRNHLDMRAVIVDACLTGRLRQRLPNIQPAVAGDNFIDLIDADDVMADVENLDDVDAAEQQAILNSLQNARRVATVTGLRNIL